MVNRRQFLSAIGAAAAGFALDPEILLWKPGAKTIFLPPATSYAVSLSGVLCVGDVIEINDNGYGHPYLAVNPITRQVMPGVLKRFIVTSVAGCNAELSPAPNLIGPGAMGRAVPWRLGGSSRI